MGSAVEFCLIGTKELFMGTLLFDRIWFLTRPFAMSFFAIHRSEGEESTQR